MRVLLTTDTVGGVWTFTRELTEQLTTQGHRVALVSFGRAPSATQSAWIKATIVAHRDGFLFHGCDAPLEWMQDNHLAWDEGAKLLMDVAETFQADVLHSNQFCWGALPLAVPKLITAHSDVRSWAAACRGGDLAPSLWLDRYDSLVRDGINGADALASPTAWMHNALLAHYEVAVPFHVISNGRTLPKFAARCKREVRAVSVGRLWDEGKGLAMLSGICSPMPIFLAGEPTFERAVTTKIPSQVTALGTLDERSLFDLFSTSAVYLATSLYEPFGLAPVEAALCGCAIVARDIPSFREVWGDAALYFKDAIGLEDVLVDLRTHPEKLCESRVAAAERAAQFTSKRMADRYASLYRELIKDLSCGGLTVEQEQHAA